MNTNKHLDKVELKRRNNYFNTSLKQGPWVE